VTARERGQGDKRALLKPLGRRESIKAQAAFYNISATLCA
jgi:hypothetical protein